MADNTPQNGTATIAADDIGGVLHQRVKVEYGGDGSATEVSTTNPLPVQPAQISTASATVSFTAPTGTATAGNVLVADSTRKKVILQNIGAGDVFLGFDRAATLNTQYILKANAANEFNEDSFTGSISAISATTGNVVLITEFAAS